MANLPTACYTENDYADRKKHRTWKELDGVGNMGNMNDCNANNTKAKLPPAFLARMRVQLGNPNEYEAFLDSYDQERTYGLRYNPLKTDRERFIKEMPFTLRAVPWAEEGFYYKASEQPGRHTLHEVGAFYIQEPSAMAVVPVLDPKPGERILDLCAAPGGKSTQIAGRMQGRGLLVSNEIIPSRARILSQNIERLGIANCVVCKENPKRLLEAFPAFFDRVLVDAPCSGEGMFRKDDAAIAEWSPENVSMCAARQRDILEQAAGMVCPGGVLVYSTCTFSVQENEEVISSFIKAHPEFDIEETGAVSGIVHSPHDMMENVDDGVSGLNKTIRLWPHRIKGEGHFIARLRKTEGMAHEARRTMSEELIANGKNRKERNRFKGKDKNRTKAGGQSPNEPCENFLYKELGLTETGKEKLYTERLLFNFGEAIYLMPETMIPIKGLQIERPGLQLGFCEKGRLKPSHALALFLHPEYVRKSYELSMEQAERYIRGETFNIDSGLKGWYLLSVHGFSIGFGKAAGGQMKNHYPKGLRR